MTPDPDAFIAEAAAHLGFDAADPFAALRVSLFMAQFAETVDHLPPTPIPAKYANDPEAVAFLEAELRRTLGQYLEDELRAYLRTVGVL